jgi:uncharacterized OB-fold protein
MSTMKRPLPVEDHLSKPFWDGCREHRLLIKECITCGKAHFPPGPVCTHCRSRDLKWIEATGYGKVYSWIIVRHPVPSEIYQEEIPYVVALVDLAEGVRMPSNIVGCTPEDVHAGMQVELIFRDLPEGVSLPQYRPLAN